MTHRNVLRAAGVTLTLAVSCRVYDSSLLTDDAGGAGTGSSNAGATSGSSAGAQSGGGAGLADPSVAGEMGMAGQGGAGLPGIGGETSTAGPEAVGTAGHSGSEGNAGAATGGAGGRSNPAGGAGGAGTDGSSGRTGGGTGGYSGSAPGGTGGSSGSASAGSGGSSGRANGGSGGASASAGGGSSGSAAGGSGGAAGSSGGAAGSAAGSAGMGGSAGAGGVVVANGCANLSVPLSAPSHKARFVITLTNKLNFGNATISMRFYVKTGVGGVITNYVQDSNFNLLKNTSPAKLSASTSWQTLSWKIAEQDVGSSGIVVSDVARVGIELNAAPDSTWSNPTIVYVDSITVSSPALSFSFDTNSTISPTPSKNDAPGQALWPNAYAEDTTTSNVALGWLASCP